MISADFNRDASLQFRVWLWPLAGCCAVHLLMGFLSTKDRTVILSTCYFVRQTVQDVGREASTHNLEGAGEDLIVFGNNFEASEMWMRSGKG